MKLLTTEDLVTRWGVAHATLANWRRTGAGPDFIRLENRTVRYHPDVIDAYERDTANVPFHGRVEDAS